MNLQFGQAGNGLAVVVGLWSMLLALATLIVHIAFAVGVMSDSAKVERQGRQTVLVAAIWWTIATLIGGVFVAAAYWFVHHSSRARVESRPERDLDTAPTKSRAEVEQEEKIATDVLLNEPPATA